MNTLSRTFFYTGLFLLLPSTALAQQETNLPESVEAYYQKRNLAAAISTPTERLTILHHPDSTLSERLEVVKGLAFALAGQEIAVDPGMVIDPGIILDRDMLGTRVTDYAFVPPHLAEIVAVHRTEPDVLNVELLVRHIQMDDNLQFIRMYERKKKYEDVHPHSVSSVTTRETHTWYYFDGRWLRQPASMVKSSDPNR